MCFDLPMAVYFVDQNAILLIFTMCFFDQESVEGATTSAALKTWKLSSRASSDVLHFGENRDRIRSLEQDVVTLKGHVDVARAKENSKSSNQQLEGKISILLFIYLILVEADPFSSFNWSFCSEFG